MNNAGVENTPYTVEFYPSPLEEVPRACKWRDRPQMRSMVAGALILMSGGMNMALGLGWNMTTGVPTTQQFQFCWFIGVIVGALVAATLIGTLQKRYYMIVSGLLVLAGGIIFASAPYNYDAVIAARYINGIGVGFATVPFIVHGSEASARTYRGACLAIEQFSLSLGIAIQVIYASQWSLELDFAANRVHGIFSIAFGFAAVSSAYAMIESPIFYLREGKDSLALECLRYLSRPFAMTNEKRAELEEDKSYVVSNEQLGFGGSFAEGLGPLVKVLLYRGVLAFTFSTPISMTLLMASNISVGSAHNWVPIVFAVLRLFGAIMGIWMLDVIGRKMLSLFWLFIVGAFAIGLCVIFHDPQNILDDREMSIVCVLLLLSQLFAGLWAASTTTYLGEAFPMLVKPYFIALCVIVQMVVPIIGICTFEFSVTTLFDYYISIGVIICTLTLFFAVLLPETRNATLREAQALFQRWFYVKCN